MMNHDDSNGSKTEQRNLKAETLIEKLLNYVWKFVAPYNLFNDGYPPKKFNYYGKPTNLG